MHLRSSAASSSERHASAQASHVWAPWPGNVGPCYTCVRSYEMSEDSRRPAIPQVGRQRQPQLWHFLGRAEVRALSAVATADALLFAVLAYAIVNGPAELALVIVPTSSVLFMVLACSLGAFAKRGVVSWSLVCAVLLAGPVAAAVALQRCGVR